MHELHVIKLCIGNLPLVTKSCHTEVALCSLRIGHTHSAHAYLLCSGDSLTCDRWGEPFTVLHILLRRSELEAHQKKHFILPSRQHLPLHPAMFIDKDFFLVMNQG